MNITFLIPTSGEDKNPERIFCNYAFFFQHNVFLLYPATLLKENGFNVKIIDCPVENKLLDDAISGDTDIYVFYSVFLSRNPDLKAASYIESKKGKDTCIVFIGSDPTYKPENYLLSENRFVIRGEPEYGLLDFVQKYSKKEHYKINGLSYQKNNEVIHNAPGEYIKDIDTLPLPDRKLFADPYKYYNPKFKKLPGTTMLTSRGCAFQCYYCMPNSLSFARELEWKRYYKNKPPVTKRSPQNIISEFDRIKEEGYKSVFVIDDQFIWGRERTLEILSGIKYLQLEIAVLARPDMIQDEEIANALAGAGVKFIDLGVESFNQAILDDIKKNLKISTIKNCIHLLKKAGIEPELNILFGCSPLETKETIRSTIEEVNALDIPIVHAKVCTPFPGTEFHDIAKAKGWMTVDEYTPIYHTRESIISYPHLTDKELVKYVRKFYKQHYFNILYILKQLFKTKSYKEFTNKARTAFNMWKNILK